VEKKTKSKMITVQDLYNIVGNKISHEMQKAIIRNNFPPQIAERMCAAIDAQEKTDHFRRLLMEYNEWLVNQQRQQEMVQRFLREYYNM
jgi:hypothetical protein